MEEADRYGAEQKDGIRRSRESHETLSLDPGKLSLFAKLGGEARPDRIAGYIAHRHNEASAAGNAEQRTHQRIKQGAEQMDNAEAQHELGQHEEWKEGREQHVPPDGKSTQGRIQRSLRV
ncbi:hypothetical protein D3C71_1860080 [compost metagenome]